MTDAEFDLAIQNARLERAQLLLLQGKAVEHGLDPANALPEDILLLDTDDKGRLKVENDWKRAVARVQEEQNARQNRINEDKA